MPGVPCSHVGGSPTTANTVLRPKGWEVGWRCGSFPKGPCLPQPARGAGEEAKPSKVQALRATGRRRPGQGQACAMLPGGARALPLCGGTSRPSSHPKPGAGGPKPSHGQAPPPRACLTPESRPTSKRPCPWDQGTTKLSKRADSRAGQSRALGETPQAIGPLDPHLPLWSCQDPPAFQAGER